jgi:hypothetical protein
VLVYGCETRSVTLRVEREVKILKYFIFMPCISVQFEEVFFMWSRFFCCVLYLVYHTFLLHNSTIDIILRVAIYSRWNETSKGVTLYILTTLCLTRCVKQCSSLWYFIILNETRVIILLFVHIIYNQITITICPVFFKCNIYFSTILYL